MRQRVLLATLFTFLAASGNPAHAGLPPSFNSTIPGQIRLVGADPLGHPDPAGEFTVTVRDLANSPMAGSLVDVDFTAATDVALCGVQGAGTSLVASVASGVTGADGQVTMTLLGHGIAGAPPSSSSAVRIYADGVLLGSIPCAAFDLDGVGGLNGADESRWLADYITGLFMPRGNYDNSGALGGSDLSIWLSTFVRGKQVQSCPSVVTSPN